MISRRSAGDQPEIVAVARTKQAATTRPRAAPRAPAPHAKTSIGPSASAASAWASWASWVLVVMRSIVRMVASSRREVSARAATTRLRCSRGGRSERVRAAAGRPSRKGPREGHGPAVRGSDDERTLCRCPGQSQVRVSRVDPDRVGASSRSRVAMVTSSHGGWYCQYRSEHERLVDRCPDDTGLSILHESTHGCAGSGTGSTAGRLRAGARGRT